MKPCGPQTYALASLGRPARASSAPGSASIVALGDSITDGHGATTNGNDRWPDRLLDRVEPALAAPELAVAGLHVFTFNQVAETERWRVGR